MSTTNHTWDVDFDRIRDAALKVGGICLIFSFLFALVNVQAAGRCYLVGYLLPFGIALGSLAMLMIHHLTGGAWGLIIRRPLEAATRTLPLLALLFIPIALSAKSVYIWADHGRVDDAIKSAESEGGPEGQEKVKVLEKFKEELEHKERYLNLDGIMPPGFLARAVIYFAIWITLAVLFSRWSREQDLTGDPKILERFGNLSGPGLVLYFLTVTGAAVDWVMSLEPTWYSTIYGVQFGIGMVLSGFAFMCVLLAGLVKKPPYDTKLQMGHLRDLGGLMLAFVMLWAYVSFSQLLLIWAGNLPEEIPWYIKRIYGPWSIIAVLLLLGHFFLPFLLLLQAPLKRNVRTLAMIGGLVLTMHFFDLLWLVLPAGKSVTHLELSLGQDGVSWYEVPLAIIALAGVGGIWLWNFLRELPRENLLPLRDPYMAEALHHE